MLKDIVAVKPLSDYLDVSQLIEFSGIFALMKDVSYFNQVQLNSELGTIVWPNEADLDPDVLYAIIKGEPIPNYEQRTVYR